MKDHDDVYIMRIKNEIQYVIKKARVDSSVRISIPFAIYCLKTLKNRAAAHYLKKHDLK